MRSGRWDERFWASTRGRIVLLLRGGDGTVNELAGALGLTDNAVRPHLTALERDGLVRPIGTRPGRRKPNVTYGLTPEAGQQLFPRMYGPVLRRFLDVLGERLSAKKLEDVVRAVAHRLAADYPPATRSAGLPERIARAAAVLGAWGGFCRSERLDGTVSLRCSDCPLGLVAAGHPAVCLLVETVLADVVGLPVRQHCQAEPSPQCRFDIEIPARS